MFAEGSGGEQVEPPCQTDSFGLQFPENLKISAFPQSVTELPHDLLNCEWVWACRHSLI